MARADTFCRPSRSLPGQAALLREPKSRSLINRVKEDTESLRGLRATSYTSDGANSYRSSSYTTSTYSVEREILNSAVYRRTNAQRLPEQQREDIQVGRSQRAMDSSTDSRIMQQRTRTEPADDS
jgi:hypothetical protein